MAKVHLVTRENLSTRTYRELKTALLDGRFEAGERIKVGELAEMMGTSITPVREAIFRLVSEQALEMTAATSIRVPILPAERLDEIMTMRILLEGQAAERAAIRMSDGEIERLERIQEEFVAAAASDPKAASLRNREFHFALMKGAEMPLLSATVESLWVMMGSLINEFHMRVPKRDLTTRRHQHYNVLDALQKRDAKAAGDGIRADLEWGRLMVDWARERDAAQAEAQASAASR